MNRNVNSYFSTLPSIDIERSRFGRPFQHKTTFNAGQLIPIFFDEILPGDSFTLDMASLVRMSTPIFPTYDNAYLDTYFFFVPNRLVWTHWKDFMGENTQGAWAPTTEYTIPQIKANHPFGKGSLADFFGLPTDITNFSVSHLPFRAYILIWNEFFRDQNTMPPAYVNLGDQLTTNIPFNQNSSNNTFDRLISEGFRGYSPFPVCKYHDYFTSVLPQPQKGSPVEISLLGSMAPVVTGDTVHSESITNPLQFSPVYPFSGVSNEVLGINTTSGGLVTNGTSVPDGDVSGLVAPSNLYANLENVAVATISQLRQAFQLQKLFEKDARGGSRYREILKMHFQVDNMDARMQIPEYLGGKRIPINIDQVLQTSATSEVSPQGNASAYSMTSDVSSVFTKSFTEHGMLIGLCCVRTDHTYQQGIERYWSKKSRFDFYWPTLANISEQPVLVKEIYAQGNEHDDDAFGYQEPWAEYRFKPSRVSGAFRSNYDQTLDSWHYADYYTGGNDTFVLSPEWLCETKNNIDRTLAVTSAVEDQFLADFYFKLDCYRPMPLHSIPGLIDHH